MLTDICVCIVQRTDVFAPVKRRYTGALVERQSQLAVPWKLKVLQLDLMNVDGISHLSGFQVCPWFIL